MPDANERGGGSEREVSGRSAVCPRVITCLRSRRSSVQTQCSLLTTNEIYISFPRQNGNVPIVAGMSPQPLRVILNKSNLLELFDFRLSRPGNHPSLRVFLCQTDLFIRIFGRNKEKPDVTTDVMMSGLVMRPSAVHAVDDIAGQRTVEVSCEAGPLIRRSSDSRRHIEPRRIRIVWTVLLPAFPSVRCRCPSG